MSKKVIPVKVKDRRNIFETYLRLLNPVLKLREREIQVLGYLLFYNDYYSKYDENVKWKMVFDYETRVTIKTDLGLSDFSFNNILTALRKKNLLIGNTIKKGILIYPPENKFELNFIFINGQGTKEVDIADKREV
jgi:hypothetical protein